MILVAFGSSPLPDAWLDAIWRASWQGALAIAFVWLVCREFPRLPPNVSCWLWRLALVKMLVALVPWGTFDLAWLPAKTATHEAAVISTRVDSSDVATAPFANQNVKSAANPDSVDANVDHAPSTTSGPIATTPAVSSVNWTSIARPMLFGIWVAVLLATFVLVGVRVLAARRWRREWRLITDHDLLTLNERLSVKLGLFQPPVLFEADSCQSPMVFGALRSAIVLPSHLVADSSSEELRMILAHELAHVRRGDLVGNWFSTAVAALFFFHPGVWLALRESRLAQEMACDELALARTGVVPARYGQLLVDLAAGWPRVATPLLAVGMVESFQLFLKRRLTAMKIERGNSRTVRVGSLVVVLVAAIGLLPWRLVARAQTIAANETARDEFASDATSGSDRDGRATLNAKIVANSGPYTLTIDRVRRVVARGHDEFPNGFPIFAGMPLNEHSETHIDGNSSAGGGAISGGFGGTYTYKRPSLVLDVILTKGNAKSEPGEVCNVKGKFTGKDEQGLEVDGSQAAHWQKLLVDGVDYPMSTGRTAIHLALAGPSVNAKKLATLDGELLVAEGSVVPIEFSGRDLLKPATKRAGGLSARLEDIKRNPDGVEIQMAVSPPAQNQESKLDAIRRGANMTELMKKDMLAQSPGRVTVVMVDSRGESHYGQPENQGNSSGSRSSAGGISSANSSNGSTSRSFSWSSSGDNNGVKTSRVGSSNRPQPNSKTGLVSETYRFPPLPSGVDVAMATCVVTTCASEPKPVAFHFENVPIPAESSR